MFKTIILIITCYNVVKSDDLSGIQNLLVNNETWLTPQPTLFKVYIYNVTNSDEFLNNGTKLTVEELGPYVYEETWERENVVFHDNGTVSFNQKKIYKFNPELSNGTEDDVVVVPNIPMLTTTSLSKDAARFFKLAMGSIFDILRTKPFVEVKVSQLLWGYEDPLLILAKDVVPKEQILRSPSDKFGLMYGKNGSSPDRLTLSVNKSIEAINGKPYFTHDTSEKCKNLKAFDGRISPPLLNKEEVLHVFGEHFCRVLPLAYENTITTSDNETIYRLTPSDNKNSETSCFCDREPPCAPSGFFNVSLCHYDTPILVSFPHFYLANDSYRTTFEGISPPDPAKHKYYVDINAANGIVKSSRARVQINLAVSHVSDIKQVANFPDIVFPVMWFEEEIDVKN